MKSMSGELLFRQASSAWDAGEFELAFRLFISSSKNGYTESMSNLGYFLIQGLVLKLIKMKL